MPANTSGSFPRLSSITSLSHRAGVAGSARQSRCLSVCLITAGSSMLAITFTAPPQCSHVVYLKHPLQPWRLRLIERWRAGAGSLAASVLRRPRRVGVTCSRSRWFGAKTPLARRRRQLSRHPRQPNSANAPLRSNPSSRSDCRKGREAGAEARPDKRELECRDGGLPSADVKTVSSGMKGKH